jgi:peptide/nickel transport system permease protein
MDWWQRLKKNPLAKFGGLLLLVFYLAVIAAELVSPYDPYVSQTDGALLPPTQVYWTDQAGKFIGPQVYPTTQGAVDLQTGDRALKVDRSNPSRLRLFVQGEPYRLFQTKLPLPTRFSLTDPKFDEIELFSGIPGNLHLFGTDGGAKFNLLGTDEQARDQFSRLVYGGRISLSIGLIGIALSFPL